MPAFIERHDFREGRARYEQMRDSHHDHLINLRGRQGDRIHLRGDRETCRPRSPASSAINWSIIGWSCIAFRSTTTSLDSAPPLTSRFDLIIFDCDGVLVDSEVISCRVHAEVLTRHGYPISTEAGIRPLLGRSSRQAHLEVEAELGRNLPDDYHTQLQDELFQSFATTMEGKCRTYDQALAAIAQPVCVASSGSHARMRVSLGRAKLYDKFAPNIFSASQVRHGKPAPDLFLFAAGANATPPERCLGHRRQHRRHHRRTAAGMAVFGFHGGTHCRPGYGDTLRAAGATLTFDDMRQLPGLIDAPSRHSGASRSDEPESRDFRARCWRIAPE